MEYYDINGKLYYINLDNLFKLVGELPSKEKIVNTTITQVYNNDTYRDDEDEEDYDMPSDIFGNGKEIVESKSNANETMSTVRYDLIRFMITTLFNDKYNNNGVVISVENTYDLTLAQKIALNTLIENKILMEIGTNE